MADMSTRREEEVDDAADREMALRAKKDVLPEYRDQAERNFSPPSLDRRGIEYWLDAQIDGAAHIEPKIAETE